MAPDPILHERIYDDLKAAIRSGGLRPGQHIDLNVIADEHRASVTPVREAVCRLVGEGLVEFQRHGGFQLAALRAEDVRGLYLLNACLLARAIRICSDDALSRTLGSTRLPREGADAVDMATAAATLFSAIGAAAGDGIFLQVIENISDRLAAARIAESQILRGLRGELDVIKHGPTAQVGRSLSRRIAGYHRRRLPVVNSIARLSHLGAIPREQK